MSPKTNNPNKAPLANKQSGSKPNQAAQANLLSGSLGNNRFAAIASSSNNEFGSAGNQNTTSTGFGQIASAPAPNFVKATNWIDEKKLNPGPEEFLDFEEIDLGEDEDDDVEANPVIERQLKLLEEKAEKENKPIQLLRKQKLLTRLPEHLQFTEDHPAYRHVPEIITKRYSGRDGGEFSSHQTGKKSSKPAAIFLTQTQADGSTQARELGAGFENIDLKTQTPLIRTWVNDNTQYPSVSIQISPGRGKRNIEARVYGSKLRVDVNKAFEFNIGLDRNMDYYQPGSALAAQAHKGQIIQKILRLDSEVSSISWVGISRQHLFELEKKMGDGEKMEEWEEAAVCINNAHEIAISTYPDTRVKSDKLKKFAEYFEACMDTTRMYGDFWFLFFGDTTIPLKDREFTFKGLEWQPPRWLVTHWWPVLDDQGKIVEAIPVKWSNYGDVTVWPTPETGILAWRMSLGRARDTKTATLQNALDKQSSIIKARFVENHLERGSFRVDIWCSLTSPTVNIDDMRPEPMTVVELQVYQTDGKWSPNQYKGIVVPNMWKSNASFSVYVKGKPDITLNDSTQDIRIKVTSDEVAIARQDAAMRAILELIQDEARDGPDIGNVALGCEPQKGDTNTWVKDLKESQKKDILNICKKEGLNVQQMQLVEDFLTSKSGFSTLIGPPGTGKSQVIVAIVKAFNITNKIHRPNEPHYKVMIAAPCNFAVNQLCKRTVDSNVDEHGNKLFNICRFLGGSIKKSKSPDQAMTGTAEGDAKKPEDEEKEIDAEAMSAAYFELAEAWMAKRKTSDELAEYYSDFQFRNFIEETFKTSKNNELKNVARRWLLAERALKPGNSAGEEKAKARASKLQAEDVLLPWFWRTIDVVCVTLNSAAHDKLRAFFRATLIIIDEAGMAAIPDMMTAIVPNFKSLQHIILAGDPKQQRPTILADGQNEFGKLQETSLLEKVKLGLLQDQGLHHVQLQNQYRSVPEIADMWAQLSYEKDGLTNDPSVITPKPVMGTFKKLFRGLGETNYKDWACFAVSVSNAEAYSQKWKGTMSQFNAEESKLIVATIERLISEEPAEGCPKVQLKDIMVLSPYQGQINNIQSLVSAKNWTKDPSNILRVESTGKIQGDSAPIIILSMCTNKPSDPTKTKFVADGHRLNVAISRPESALIVFGNFLPWVEAVRSDPKFFSKKGSAMFGNLIQYLHPKETNKERKVVSDTHLKALLNKQAIKDEETFGELIKLAGNMSLGGRKRGADDIMGHMMTPYTKDRGKLKAQVHPMALVRPVELSPQDFDNCSKAIATMLERIRSYEQFTPDLLHKEWDIAREENWGPGILAQLKRAAEDEFMKGLQFTPGKFDQTPREAIVDPALINVPSKPGEKEEIENGVDVSMHEAP